MRVRTYCFPGCFTRPPGTSTRNHPHEPTTSKPVVPGGYVVSFDYRGGPNARFVAPFATPCAAEPKDIVRPPWARDPRLPQSIRHDGIDQPWLPAPAPEPPPGYAAPSTRTRRPRPADGRARLTTARRPPFEERRPSWLKRTLGPIVAAIAAFAGQAQDDPAAAAEAEAADDRGHDARLDRGLRVDLGRSVRRRLRRPAARPRDGPRDPASPRGHQGQRADVHPVPGRA